RLVAPLRPTLKERYPLIPIEEYVHWRREDGRHVDPWIRTHERVGGRVTGTAEEAMLIRGPREAWEGWTGLSFPGDGAYVVPGGLVPVHFRGEHGVYREPCVWMEHVVRQRSLVQRVGRWSESGGRTGPGSAPGKVGPCPE